jgi:chromosome segregation protein
MSDGLPEIFKQGTKWVRADFHLHTRRDKEFESSVHENSFVDAFVDCLTKQDVRVAVITNHNKFDLDEYRALRRGAKKREIFLLPGVELSVNDGANGIHVLVTFDPASWLVPESNWIDDFLQAAFHDTHVVNRASKNARCGWSLNQLFQKLHDAREKHGRDSFVVLAHVEDRCGFFRELDGGRVGEFKDQPLFWSNVLGLQKVRSHDEVKKWRQWLGDALPAFVEGSDPKTVEAVGSAHISSGEERRCYLYIGDFTFDAVKLALLNHSQRVATSPITIAHPHVISVEARGSGPAGVKFTWNVNSGMNNLIGIRGSGKSTILELLRYGIGVDLRGPWTADPPDETYKTGLIKTHLGSGGQVIVRLRGDREKEYEVRRIFGEPPKTYVDGKMLPNLRPNDILCVLYFGQKDLGELGREDRNTDLIEKFYSEELRDVRSRTASTAEEVRDLVHKLQKQTSTLGRREEFLATKAKLQESLKAFEEHKVAEKLNRQVRFNADIAAVDDMAEWLIAFADELEEIRSDRSAELAKFDSLESAENPTEIAAAKKALAPARTLLADIKARHHLFRQSHSELKRLRKVIVERRQSLDEEFAAIRRAIQGVDLNADSFVELQRRLRSTNLSLEELTRQEEKRRQTQLALNRALEDLRNAWHAEFQAIEAKVRGLNERALPIELELHYRGNKNAFTEFLKDLVRGSGVTAPTIERISEEFVDPVEVYQDVLGGGTRWKTVVTVVSSRQKIEDRINQQLSEFLTFRVPDRLELRLHKKPLSQYSLGQRTSALVLFLLEKGDYDLLLIDQPEDDLDNQTIYSDVIRRIKDLKTRHQFVFATHNANIPVLGEAEMVGSCTYGAVGLELRQGSTDHPPIQNDIIAVMEGGDEAFRLRNRIYQQWNH